MLAKVYKVTDATDALSLSLPRIGGFPAFAGSEALESSATPSLAAMSESMAFSEADRILQNAREEAERIIAESKEANLRETGPGDSAEERQKEFDAAVALQVDDLRRSLTETIESISSLAATITSKAEKDLVELALQIAKKVVHREVTIDRDIALTLVKVSLNKLNNRTLAKVHLNPDELDYVSSHRDACDFHGGLEFVADRSVTQGGCLVQTETGDIDARIESQFEEIARGLFE